MEGKPIVPKSHLAERTFRILWVDDEIPETQIRSDVMEHLVYSFVLCRHPATALGCDLSTIDLGIVGFKMPELNGRELLLQLRALGARFPILLFSRHVDTLSHDDRILFTRCIDKSWSIQSLLDVIAVLLKQSGIPDFGA